MQERFWYLIHGNKVFKNYKIQAMFKDRRGGRADEQGESKTKAKTFSLGDNGISDLKIFLADSENYNKRVSTERH